MKKIVGSYIVTAVSLVSLVSLTGCWDAKKDQTHQVQPAENMKTIGEKAMARIKEDSGLEYEILQEGAGNMPEVGQQVTVHYTGWLDKNGELGAKFDSSVDRGMPFTFIIGVGQVIKGWDEGVKVMKPGEKRRLVIPAHLGYGARGAGQVIPPHATLIFDVELISVS